MLREDNQNNDILGDWVQARQNIRQFKYQVNASKKSCKKLRESYLSILVSIVMVSLIKAIILSGRGYTRTPKEFSWEGETQQKR